MSFLTESTRDNLLQPFVDIYNQKTGSKATIGQMKTYLLDKFVSKAYIRNLTLSSNYYLAGVARYYFNGDLTNNKELGIFTDTPDDFNLEICKRLNALILILRNKYIDSVGTVFEQPEDFGNISIAKLLRKYNKAINQELGLNQSEEERLAVNESHRVGNGYTYEILYSFQDAKKYREFTEPGAWCITRQQNWYDDYIKRRKIHYVIFLKDGYENVPRKKGPEWTPRKPQDEYGNSMIALLQLNNSYEPDYITSRWNHGQDYERTSCEADYAYTKEEFCNIVGINDDVLQKIYNEWRLNAKEGVAKSRKEQNQEKQTVLRKIKYAQILLNGGNQDPFEGCGLKTTPMSNTEKLNNLFTKYAELYKNAQNDEERSAITAKWEKVQKKILKDSVKACSITIAEGTYYFLMDGSKILFETIVKADSESDNINYHFETSEEKKRYGYGWAFGFKNIVVCTVVNGYMLYNTRIHNFVTIEGINKFKYVPRGLRVENKKNDEGVYEQKTMDGVYEIKMSSTKIALVDVNTNTPITLPNGHCWFIDIRSENSYGYSDTDCRHRTKYDLSLKIIYTNNESYYYDLNAKKFVLNIPNDDARSHSFLFMPSNNHSGIYGIKVYNAIHLFKNGEEISPSEAPIRGCHFIGESNFSIRDDEHDWYIYNFETGEAENFIMPCEHSPVTYGLTSLFYTDEWPHSNGIVFDNRFFKWVKNTINPATENDYEFHGLYGTSESYLRIRTQDSVEKYALSNDAPEFIRNTIRESAIISESDIIHMVKKCVSKILKEQKKRASKFGFM